MMKRFMNGLIPTTIVAMAISACGGGPDIDKVKADFDNPSGSAKDKNAVIAANGKQNTAGDNSALALAGGGVPGFSSGGLTVEGRSSHLAKFAPLAILMPKVQTIPARIERIKSGNTVHEPLRAEQFGSDLGCFESSDFDEAAQKIAEQMAAGETSFSISIHMSADLANCDSSLSGSMKMSIDMKVDQTSFAMKIESTFNNVCDNDEGSCIDGSMAQDAAFNLSSMDSASFKSVSAWDFTATAESKTIKSKGGLRIGYLAAEASEQAKIEYLEYVTDSTGNEVSYVLIIEANTMDGTASITIKCNDGELTCTFNENSGEGMCSGTIDGSMYDESWTADDYTSVVDSEDFKG